MHLVCTLFVIISCQIGDAQSRRKRNLTHEWAHEWLYEWPQEPAHESPHESTHEG